MMIRDFSTTFDGKQSIRFRPVQAVGTSLLWRFTGLVISVAMILGVTASLVFGWMVQAGLDDIGTMGQSRLELMKTQQELLQEKDALLVAENIELMASKISLYPPEKKQIRRP